uniref:uncharacterized protein LOC117609749 n=1 Tax=Osmia lignaria TaxID=473952 RepID=UPI001479146E|nr:uncharacterized protein LOC117609749 [Osmia lignaria]
MPPFSTKLVRARRRKGRKNSLRGDSVIFVEESSIESPSRESSSSIGRFEPRLQESSLVPAQSTMQSWGEPGGVSVPSSSTANNTLMIPPRPLPSNVLNFSSDANEHQTNTLNLESLQPSKDSMTRDAVTSSPKLSKTFTGTQYNVVKSFIPHFDGKPSQVNHFIAQCRLADTLAKTEDKTLLLAIIRNRMQHRVYRGIVGDDEPETVEELIALIKSTFAQSFNLNDTQNELKTVRRRESESIEEYGFRVNDILDRGVQGAKEDLSSEEFGGIKKLLMTSAVAGFLGGLGNDVVASILSNDDVKDLRAAIKLASKIETQVNSSRNSQNTNVSDTNSRVLIAKTRNRKCVTCGKAGHISADCQVRRDRRFINSNRDHQFPSISENQGNPLKSRRNC